MKLTPPDITPGPWRPELPQHGFHDPLAPDGSRVCFIPTREGCPTEANARAIAALPELLAALERIHANAAESPEWIRRHTTAALTKAGYTIKD